MKVKATKLVTVQLEMTGEEAIWLAQLCVQVGGASGAPRDFYHDVWNQVREAVGEIPSARDVFTWKNGADATKGIYLAGQSESKEQ